MLYFRIGNRVWLKYIILQNEIWSGIVENRIRLMLVSKRMPMFNLWSTLLKRTNEKMLIWVNELKRAYRWKLGLINEWYVHYCKMSKSYRGTVPSMNKVDIQIAQIQIDRTAASNVAKAVPKQYDFQINSKHENRSGMPFSSFWLSQEPEITKENK